MNNDKLESRIGYFVLGAAAGAVAAVLLAPDSGKKTRRLIRKQSEEALEYVMDAGKDLADRSEQLYKRSAELLGDTGQDLAQKYNDVAKRCREIAGEASDRLRKAAENARS